jgi:hypothetical protein
MVDRNDMANPESAKFTNQTPAELQSWGTIELTSVWEEQKARCLVLGVERTLRPATEGKNMKNS